MDILSAFLNLERKNFKIKCRKKFDKYVDLKNAIVLDQNGNVKDGVKAFDVDIKKENKENAKESDKNYPLFIGKNKEGKTVYIIPVVGKGMGPYLGYICVGENKQTIVGASFGHKTETPGLGAEISQEFCGRMEK